MMEGGVKVYHLEWQQVKTRMLGLHQKAYQNSLLPGTFELVLVTDIKNFCSGKSFSPSSYTLFNNAALVSTIFNFLSACVIDGDDVLMTLDLEELAVAKHQSSQDCQHQEIMSTLSMFQMP